MKTSQAQLPLPSQVLSKTSVKQLVSAAVKKVLQILVESFIGSNELRIWQTYDQYGNNWWHAYDPVTGRHTSVQTESELRAWIERRYYN